MPDHEMTDEEPLREWDEPEELDEPIEELPPRPRRRLLGAGGNPVVPTLLGVLLIACGFIGGVLVEKGQASSSSTAGTGAGASGLAARFAALRAGAASSTGAAAAGASGGSASGGAPASAGSTAGSGADAGAGGGFGRAGNARGAGATIGQVAYLDGSTLYVTNTEGNTVKITPAPGANVTKTVKTDVRGIHPGETVVVTGAAGTNGAISAESIRVGAGTTGGLGGLFGAGGGAGAVGGHTGGSGGEPALFGKG